MLSFQFNNSVSLPSTFTPPQRTVPPTSFFSHPLSLPPNSRTFFAQKTLSQAANAARRAARKHLVLRKSAVGWGWRQGKVVLVCPCQRTSVLDHRACFSRGVFSSFRAKNNTSFSSSFSSFRKSYVPRGVRPALREAAKNFHLKNVSKVEDLSAEEMVNKCFVKEKVLKERGYGPPLTTEEKKFISEEPTYRTQPKAPKIEDPLLPKWNKCLHPILENISIGPFEKGPKKAKKDEMAKIIEKFPNKGFIGKNFTKDIKCYVCKCKGHLAVNGDNLPTLRRMRTSTEEKYLRFWIRQKPVAWNVRKEKLEDLIRSFPKITRRIDRIAREAMERWGKSDPFDKDWAFPLIIRKAAPYYYAIGCPPTLITKIIAGDKNEYIEDPKRLEYPNPKPTQSAYYHVKWL